MLWRHSRLRLVLPLIHARALIIACSCRKPQGKKKPKKKTGSPVSLRKTKVKTQPATVAKVGVNAVSKVGVNAVSKVRPATLPRKAVDIEINRHTHAYIYIYSMLH